ncbi:MAG: family 78 glycoside hydrolase catalytic domain [Oscillospiraceae bacterium]|nr:family 78 glycoside hydrolase catalytic domain [Oscillospiraceae bacterium]
MNFKLKCCGKSNPIGVDKNNIRLSFALCGDLEIARCAVRLLQTDTGKTVCSLPVNGTTVWLQPEAVEEMTSYTWQVEAVTADGKTVVSEQAHFETGPNIWRGSWICGSDENDAVQVFRKKIQIDASVKKARLYICGLGYFVPMLNGIGLDESYFIPPLTNYTRRPGVDEDHVGQGYRVTYYTYDVAEILQTGTNVLETKVAGGYYSNREKLDFEPQPDFSFGRPCMSFALYIEDEKGSSCWICSDDTVQVCCTNESACLYSGDRIDFTKAYTPWESAKLCPAPDGEMVAPSCPSDKLQKVLYPVASWDTPEGTVYDFGQNHSGGLTFSARAEKATELTIRFAEVLKSDGSLNYETGAWHGKHLQTEEEKYIYQENTYRLREGEQEITPQFSWFCYRYALIPHNKSVQIENLCSNFIYMDVQTDGEFECSEETLNRINQMFLQTLRCNLHSGIIMDCPHRERLPYTGDGKLIMKAACYSQDLIDFYYKWFRDLLDAQTKEGLIPNSAPYMGGGGGYAWGNAIATVTWQLYAITGDETVARSGYEAIVRWLLYYESKRDENYIIRSNSHSWMLGDWLAPDAVSSDVYYISTVCYLQAAKTALQLAQCIEPARCEKWSDLCAHIVQGINRVFFHKDSCRYGNGVQGENMLALAENIVPAQYKKQMEAELRHHYTEETNYHLDTGIVLTPVLLDYLTDHGFQDIAYKIMTAKTYPSYHSLMENDTTFSEHWSKKWPDYYFGEPGNSRLVKGGGDLSHCHPMYGSVVSWLYERVAGLDLSALHRKTVHIKPYFTDHLKWAKACKITAYGAVSVNWSNTEGAYDLRVCIPRGLTAHCHFPAKCAYLQNTKTGQIYYPDSDGYYDFILDPGYNELKNGGTI